MTHIFSFCLPIGFWIFRGFTFKLFIQMYNQEKIYIRKGKSRFPPNNFWNWGFKENCHENDNDILKIAVLTWLPHFWLNTYFHKQKESMHSLNGSNIVKLQVPQRQSIFRSTNLICYWQIVPSCGESHSKKAKHSLGNLKLWCKLIIIRSGIRMIHICYGIV